MDGHAYDAPPEFEGENQGLVEALAGELWKTRWELQGRLAQSYPDQSVQVKTSWRKTAEKVIEWLGMRGFTGPGGPPRQTGPLVYGWAFDCNDWAVYDRERGFVALVAHEADVPYFLAAPVMAEAIWALLDAVDGTPARSMPEVEALAQAAPPRPRADPPVRDILDVTGGEQADG